MSYSCSGDKNYSLYNETQPKQVIMIDEHDSVSIAYSFITTQLYQQVAQNIK